MTPREGQPTVPLDLTHPQGHPFALFCRWCRNRRTQLPSGAVVCRVCDGVLSLFAEKTQET